MRRTLLIAVCFLLGFSRSFAQDIYTYTNDVTGAYSYADPLLATASSITPVNTTAATACTSGFSGNAGFSHMLTYNASDTCYEVDLTSSAGYTIKATGFTAGLRISGTGPTRARLAYSSDGGITWIDDGVDHIPKQASCATAASGTNLASDRKSVV